MWKGIMTEASEVGLADRAMAILDARIAEVSRLSEERKRQHKDAEMYKLNTAYHWLVAARDEIAHAINESRANQ
jgi:hypothetical protein